MVYQPLFLLRSYIVIVTDDSPINTYGLGWREAVWVLANPKSDIKLRCWDLGKAKV